MIFDTHRVQVPLQFAVEVVVDVARAVDVVAVDVVVAAMTATVDPAGSLTGTTALAGGECCCCCCCCCCVPFCRYLISKDQLVVMTHQLLKQCLIRSRLCCLQIRV